ncbi:UNVERIFIED_CONTAM: UDP-N-acetylglucosamine transporter UGNT1 [Sesamum indicum]
MASADPPAQEEGKFFKGSAMTRRGAYAAIFYMTCAVLLVMFNKAALSSYNFPCANVITLCQDFFTVALGWIIFGGLPFDLLNVTGQLIGFIGSAMYAYYKLIGK